MLRLFPLIFLVFAFGCTEELANPDGTSTDVSRDLVLMWQTKALAPPRDPTHPPDPHASTDEAVAAAERIFATFDLTGLTREEILEKIGDPEKKSNSIYNFPLYQSSRDDLVYRFDTGAWGVQYNVHFDAEGRAMKVEKLGIE